MMLFKKTGKKSILVAAALSLLINTVFMVKTEEKAYASSFNMGVGNHWAETYMRNLYDRGIMTGDANGNMNPNKYITRAEFVSIINRSFGYKEKGKMPFKDIKGTEWYADAINIGYNQGYFAGDGKNISDATGNLTREQAVALLCRNVKIEEVEGENLSFNDGKTIENWSRGFVNAASKKGYISGYSDKTFKPKNYITRAEASKMFSDAVGELINTTGTKTLGYYNGNVTISASGVTLRDTVITGDLYITEGVGLGHTKLDNIHVLGEVIVSGTGESYAGQSSITFTDSIISNLIVAEANKVKPGVKSIKIDGTTVVNNTKVKSNVFLEELANRDGGFKNVTLAGGTNTELHLSGTFDEVAVKGESNKVFVTNGIVRTLIVDEEGAKSSINIDEDAYVDRLLLDIGTNITGKGEVGYLKVNAPGTKITSIPDEIEIRPGLTANVGGKNITSQEAEALSSSPRILSGYPKFTEIGATDVTVAFQTNKTGVVYWAVATYEDGRISSEDVIKPSKFNTKILKSGNVKTDSKKEYTAKISGLKAGTEYMISAVFVDEKGDESTRKTESVTTMDNTKPGFLSGYPKMGELGNTSAGVELVALKNGDVYWAAYKKGSTAPTADNLKAQKLFGNVKNGKTNVKKLAQENLSVSGLSEMEAYDVYIILADEVGDSGVKKLSFTTKDSQAPKFVEGYPQYSKVTDKALDMAVKVDEVATVNYVLCKKGQALPVPLDGEGNLSDVGNAEGKNNIISGRSGFKSGKLSVKENIEATLKLSGLEPETTYDLFLVATDKSNNISDIKYMPVSTSDNNAPTAILSFEDAINGKARPESEIYITFNEEVYYNKQKLISIGKDVLLGDASNKKLIPVIEIYNEETNEKVAIADKNKVNVENDYVLGRTKVTFESGAVALESSTGYKIRLTRVEDASGNMMGTLKPVKLDYVELPFRTVDPVVVLKKSDAAHDEVDFAFKIQPQEVAQANQNLYFDIIIEGNDAIKYTVFEINGSTVTDIGSTEINKENPSRSLQYIIKGNKTPSEFNRFKDIKDKEYGIRIDKIGSEENRNAWSKELEFKIRCVVGDKSSITNLSNKPTNLASEISKGNIRNVGDREELKYNLTFTDSVAPEFAVNPTIVSGDTFVTVTVRTTRPADLYYYVSPKSISAQPNNDEIKHGPKPERGALGKVRVETGNATKTFTITGLKPSVANEVFEIFMILQGNPVEIAEKGSKKDEFATKISSTPNITGIPSGNAEKSAFIKMTSDTKAEVYWIVYEKGKSPGESITADGIREDKYSKGAVDFGVLSIGESGGNDIITIRNLVDGFYYDFFAVAKNPDAGKDGLDSNIVTIKNVVAKDMRPPKLKEEPVTSFTDYTTTETINKYSGGFNLSFDEAVYYSDGTTDGAKPLTPGDFINNLTLTNVEIIDVKGTGGDSFSITFKNAVNNSAIAFSGIIADESGNEAGTLLLTFVENKADQGSSYWKTTFKPRPKN